MKMQNNFTLLKMAIHIVTVSPKGQISIPASERKNCSSNKYLLEVKKGVIILRPIEINVLGEDLSDKELENFSALGTASFDFWNDEDDDVYQTFYDSL